MDRYRVPITSGGSTAHDTRPTLDASSIESPTCWILRVRWRTPGYTEMAGGTRPTMRYCRSPPSLTATSSGVRWPAQHPKGIAFVRRRYPCGEPRRQIAIASPRGPRFRATEFLRRR